MSVAPLCGLQGLVDKGRDTVCNFEQGSFRSGAPLDESKSELLVFAYNIENNGRNGLSPIIDLLNLTRPDIILLSEVSRGCSSPSENGAQEIAQALEMDFAYSVAFIQQPFRDGTSNVTECTNGNAILTRLELIDVEELVFSTQCCQFGGRAGNRGSIRGRVRYRGESISVHALHLESGSSTADIIEATLTKASQAKETAKIANDYGAEDDIIVIGGDMNSPFKGADPAFFPLRYRGFFDAHGFLATKDRTTYEGVELEFNQEIGLDTLDYIFVKPREKIAPELTGICHNSEACHGWSDHTSLWTGIRFANSEVLVDPVLDHLSVRSNTADYIKADWLWICALLFLPGILAHLYFYSRRVKKNFGQALDPAGMAIGHREEIAFKCALVLGMISCLDVIVSASAFSYPFARDFGVWVLLLSLFLFVVRLRLEKSSEFQNFMLLFIFLLDTCLTASIFASFNYWVWFTWPNCTSGSCNFSISIFVVHLLLPCFLIWAVSTMTDETKANFSQFGPRCAGASTLFFVFLSLDWMSNRNRADSSEYFYGFGYFIFAPDNLMAIIFWAILFAFQFLFINKLVIRKLLLRGIGTPEAVEGAKQESEVI